MPLLLLGGSLPQLRMCNGNLCHRAHHNCPLVPIDIPGDLLSGLKSLEAIASHFRLTALHTGATSWSAFSLEMARAPIFTTSQNIGEVLLCIKHLPVQPAESGLAWKLWHKEGDLRVGRFQSKGVEERVQMPWRTEVQITL